MLKEYQIERKNHYNKMSSSRVLGEMKTEDVVFGTIGGVCFLIEWELNNSHLIRFLCVVAALLIFTSITSSANRLHKNLKILSKDVTRHNLASRERNLIGKFLSEVIYPRGEVSRSILGVYETDYAILIEFTSNKRKQYQPTVAILNKNTSEWQQLKQSNRAMKALNQIKLIDAANRKRLRRYWTVSQLFYIDKTTKVTPQVNDEISE
ncbi:MULTISPECIES: hypothetical protein [unclassified Leuconostoc]|uniref:hypothetical protein n=1 Tax=unclassified Leuconostoc TaxID=2685106 RepID=UPI0019056AD8|nr:MULTISPECIES: hypothetical protein [unclassified Leuconostoc]MBK0041504.1 hypothetical protein [Leuconostoc sp. S51]MBK0052491.1 hypothetical protein [Leuconostoc sp. S50]